MARLPTRPFLETDKLFAPLNPGVKKLCVDGKGWVRDLVKALICQGIGRARAAANGWNEWSVDGSPRWWMGGWFAAWIHAD
jgi:hypothetical protein